MVSTTLMGAGGPTAKKAPSGALSRNSSWQPWGLLVLLLLFQAIYPTGSGNDHYNLLHQSRNLLKLSGIKKAPTATASRKALPPSSDDEERFLGHDLDILLGRSFSYPITSSHDNTFSTLDPITTNPAVDPPEGYDGDSVDWTIALVRHGDGIGHDEPRIDQILYFNIDDTASRAPPAPPPAVDLWRTDKTHSQRHPLISLSRTVYLDTNDPRPNPRDQQV